MALVIRCRQWNMSISFIKKSEVSRLPVSINSLLAIRCCIQHYLQVFLVINLFFQV